MRLINLIIIPIIFIGTIITCQAQSSKTEEKGSTVIDKDVIEVYYFHNTRRCATCQSVESVTENTLKENYAEQMNEGKITFQSLNLEDDANEVLARELDVSGQTLLFVKNGKKKDLTNDAFMYARTKPEKFQEKIIMTIDNM
jgi:hypothetical protein